MENKSEKFARLAESRTNKVLNSVVSLGKLANTSHYEFSESDVESIFAAIRQEVTDVHAQFKNSLSRRQHQRFELKKA